VRFGNRGNSSIAFRRSQHKYVPTVAAVRKVIGYLRPLAFREALLGEGGQQVGVGMVRDWSGLKPFMRDFGQWFH
jgi:hypothetical protein